MLLARPPGHGEDVLTPQSQSIQFDGEPPENGGLLLAIFTGTVIVPIFFEIIQRKRG